MITTIKSDGTLFIKAESELESFALSRWAYEYIEKCGCEKIMIDTSVKEKENGQ